MDEFDTERLHLRRFRRSDGPALFGYLSRPEAVRFEPYPVRTAAECDVLATRRADDNNFWAVCLKPSGELVGNLYLAAQQPLEWRTFELGYVLHPDHWGRGYATEAAGRLVSACIDAGAHRVVARCNPENVASWRLLERLGFRREGRLQRNGSFTTDAAGQPVWHDTYLYATLASERRPAPRS